MLKIKDDVNFKEFEKFGFEEYGNWYTYNHSNYDISIYIDKKEKKIIMHSGEFGDCEDGSRVEPKLYDLIQAGLVEKVEKL